jgi:hypothetical protein
MGVSPGENGQPVAGMGADFRDFSNDGLPDIVLTGMINDSCLVFRNLGKPFFVEDRCEVLLKPLSTCNPKHSKGFN